MPIIDNFSSSEKRMAVNDIDDYLDTPKEPERSPEEAALVMRLRVFVRIRWLAIIGLVIATLIASLVFQISFPTIPVYSICLFVAFYNLLLHRQILRLSREKHGLIINRARTYTNIHIFLDMITLTVLLHFAGGIENPLVFLYIFPIIAASAALPYKRVYLLASSAILMLSVLVVLEFYEILPHNNLVGFASPVLYQEVSYILAIILSLAVVLFSSTYIATAISGELRKRQRQVLYLREQLIQEKTRELEEASESIIKLEEEKSRFLRFLSIAAHDLKAPITAIQGFLWVMLGGYAGELNEKQRNMLDRSSKRITELLELISDLLDIPRIEAGVKTIESEMSDVSMRQVVNRSLADLRNLAKQNDVRLKTEIPQGLPKVHGSAPRLQRVVTELVTNAIKYSSGGQVSLKLMENANDILIEVADDGVGIPKEDLPMIFQEFFRARNIVTETKGTGLGLSIVKSLVEAHQGKIWVESPCPETGNGCKFTISIPKGK